MTVYLVTTFSPAMLQGTVAAEIKEVQESLALNLLQRYGFISNVGHQITAEYLTIRWGMEIEFNRKPIKLEHEDYVICALPGQTLKKMEDASPGQVKNARFRFFLITCHSRLEH